MKSERSIASVRRLAKLGAACVLVVASSACKDDVNPAVVACQDYADAWARRASECGYDYQQQKTQLEAVLGCGTFTGIRDRMSFYDQCLPWIGTLTCAQLMDSNLTVDPSCDMQLER